MDLESRYTPDVRNSTYTTNTFSDLEMSTVKETLGKKNQNFHKYDFKISVYY